MDIKPFHSDFTCTIYFSFMAYAESLNYSHSSGFREQINFLLKCLSSTSICPLLLKPTSLVSFHGAFNPIKCHTRARRERRQRRNAHNQPPPVEPF
jgi:hypothetical protein